MKARDLWYWVSPCESVALSLTLREARTPIPELRSRTRVRMMLARLRPEDVGAALTTAGQPAVDHNENLNALLRWAAQDIYQRAKGTHDAT